MLVSLRNLLCIERSVCNSLQIRLLEHQTGMQDNASNGVRLQRDVGSSLTWSVLLLLRAAPIAGGPYQPIGLEQHIQIGAIRFAF
jgi:hypothetical protein